MTTDEMELKGVAMVLDKAQREVLNRLKYITGEAARNHATLIVDELTTLITGIEKATAKTEHHG